MKNICGIDLPIPLSAAPTGLSIFFRSIPRAARTYSPLTLGYDLTAPSEPLPLRGFVMVLFLTLGYALTAPSEPLLLRGFDAVIDLGYALPIPSESLSLRGIVIDLRPA